MQTLFELIEGSRDKKAHVAIQNTSSDTSCCQLQFGVWQRSLTLQPLDEIMHHSNTSPWTSPNFECWVFHNFVSSGIFIVKFQTLCSDFQTEQT